MPVDLPELSDAEWAAEERSARNEYARAHLSSDRLFLEETDGITETLVYDESEQKFHVERVQDVETVLEWCKGRYNEGLANQHCEFRLMGRYPPVVAQVFAKRWGFRDWQSALREPEMVKRLLADPDLSAFRTLGGRV